MRLEHLLSGEDAFPMSFAGSIPAVQRNDLGSSLLLVLLALFYE